MSLRAEYELGCDCLPLVDVAAAVPAAEITLRIRPGEGERPTFLVRVTGDETTAEAVEAAFDETAFVGEYTPVDADGETRRYRIRPGTSMAEQLGDCLDDLDGLRALYEAPVDVDLIRATPTGWVQRGRFADRAAFDELRTYWQDEGVSVRLRLLTREGRDDAGDGLTDPQRAALRTAHEMGYFEIPRTASLADVAAELDISASACSERLRRAQTRLVEAHVDESRADGT